MHVRSSNRAPRSLLTGSRAELESAWRSPTSACRPARRHSLHGVPLRCSLKGRCDHDCICMKMDIKSRPFRSAALQHMAAPRARSPRGPLSRQNTALRTTLVSGNDQREPPLRRCSRQFCEVATRDECEIWPSDNFTHLCTLAHSCQRQNRAKSLLTKFNCLAHTISSLIYRCNHDRVTYIVD